MRTGRWWVGVVMMAVVAALVAPVVGYAGEAASQTTDTLQQVIKKGELVVGTFDFYPPWGFRDAQNNIVIKNRRRAMLSSHVYPKATFVRDSFYGPLAMNDVPLSADCYRWFAETQNPDTGQIRTAVPFLAANESLFQPWDDDSSLLFVTWASWLQRNHAKIDPAIPLKAFDFVKTHVINDFFVSPAQPFCYWADTVAFEKPERVAHNQGLYVVALRAMLEHGWGSVKAADYDRARAHYAEFYRPDLSTLVLGKDSWWADKLDISVLFPEFLLRWLYNESALPEMSIRNTVDRYIPLTSVYKKDKTLAGLKVISASDGSFLPPERFAVPVLNNPGHYQNGGYWPMYTLVALALRYKLAPNPDLKRLIETLVKLELGPDRRSKEIVILAPGVEGVTDPNRSGYTWNALIPPALKWAGIV